MYSTLERVEEKERTRERDREIVNLFKSPSHSCNLGKTRGIDSLDFYWTCVLLNSDKSFPHQSSQSDLTLAFKLGSVSTKTSTPGASAQVTAVGFSRSILMRGYACRIFSFIRRDKKSVMTFSVICVVNASRVWKLDSDIA